MRVSASSRLDILQQVLYEPAESTGMETPSSSTKIKTGSSAIGESTRLLIQSSDSFLALQGGVSGLLKNLLGRLAAMNSNYAGFSATGQIQFRITDRLSGTGGFGTTGETTETESSGETTDPMDPTDPTDSEETTDPTDPGSGGTSGSTGPGNGNGNAFGKKK